MNYRGSHLLRSTYKESSKAGAEFLLEAASALTSQLVATGLGEGVLHTDVEKMPPPKVPPRTTRSKVVREGFTSSWDKDEESELTRWRSLMRNGRSS